MHGLQYGGFGGSHAVVIGASTTGLISAGAVARHFARVTVIDRDTLPDEPLWRKGAPQSRHVHVLLSGGRNIMDNYFPGFTTEMVERDAQLIDMAEDIAWYHSGGWKLRFPSGVMLLSLSKGFLEWSLRRRVAQIPNIAIRDKCGIKGLHVEHGHVKGVVLDDGATLQADLVIDASGRSSRSAQWLQAAGFGTPHITELPVDVGYSTRVFAPTSVRHDWRALLVHPKHPDTRCAVLLPIEDNRWQVTLVGWRGDHPPGDEEGFMEWTKGLATPDFYKAIEKAQALEPVRQWRFPSNLRRHYDKLASMPDGIVIVGDACVSINPIYAQGMSHGAIGASILDQCLFEQRARASAGQSPVAGLTRRFQKKYSKLIDECWMTSTTEDYGATDGVVDTTLRTKALNWYMSKVNELTWADKSAAKAFLDVMHFLSPPKTLFRPSFVMRTLLS